MALTPGRHFKTLRIPEAMDPASKSSASSGPEESRSLLRAEMYNVHFGRFAHHGYFGGLGWVLGAGSGLRLGRGIFGRGCWLLGSYDLQAFKSLRLICHN